MERTRKVNGQTTDGQRDDKIRLVYRRAYNNAGNADAWHIITAVQVYHIQ